MPKTQDLQTAGPWESIDAYQYVSITVDQEKPRYVCCAVRKLTMRVQTRILLLSGLLLLPVSSLGAAQISFPTPVPQKSEQSNAPSNPAPERKQGGTGGVPVQEKLMSSFEFWLSFEVLMFGMVVVIIEFLVMRKMSTTAEDVLRVYGVTMIVIGTLFAITAGFSATQVAPAMGLFGTIAGYLLGKKLRRDGGSIGPKLAKNEEASQ